MKGCTFRPDVRSRKSIDKLKPIKLNLKEVQGMRLGGQPDIKGYASARVLQNPNNLA